MKAFLQKFDFRSSRYERPTQRWICGHISVGNPCQIGPDRRGRCQATYECRPKQDGQRWFCTRPPAAGGRCPDGPLPDGTCNCAIPKCVPVRSLRSKRGRAVVWSASMTVGLLVVAFEGPAVTTLLSPGPVTLQHGEVGDCGSCHTSYEGGTVAWIHAAFAPLDAEADSEKCLACHEFGQTPLKPHSLSSDVLARSTERLAARRHARAIPIGLRAANALFGPPTRAAEDLACATCHREHQGPHFDLTAMRNRRCQSCHAFKFTSFSRGHPEIDRYPYKRRTRINFDHVLHISRHFEKAGREKAPGTCTDCHGPAQDGRMMLVDNFQETCSACHLEQITGVAQFGPKGVPFLVAPGLDLVVLREHDAAIGEWPEWSEQRVTPFMKLLLAATPGLAADLERLEGLKLLDLTDTGEEDFAAVERIAWGVKELMHDLIASSAEGMRAPLTTAFGANVDRTAVARMIAVVPLDVLRAAQEAWFPNLFQEVARHRRGERLRIPGPEEPETKEFEAATAAPGVPSSKGEEIFSQGDLLSEEDIPSDKEILLEEQGSAGEETPSEDEEIVSEKESLSAEDIPAGEHAPSEEGILAEDEILPREELAEEDRNLPAQEEEEVTAPEIDPEAWAALGGWYRRDFALYYRPLGHADRFMRSWLDMSGQVHGTQAEAFGTEVFATLSSKNSIGKCMKCHSVDREADGRLNVKWRAAQPPRGIKTATVFSHTTHFSVLHEKGCRTCHVFDPEADYAASYKDVDPASFVSNFRSFQVKTCATCHVADVAGDACLLCHRYHVGRFKTRPVPTATPEAVN